MLDSWELHLHNPLLCCPRLKFSANQGVAAFGALAFISALLPGSRRISFFISDANLTSGLSMASHPRQSRASADPPADDNALMALEGATTLENVGVIPAMYSDLPGYSQEVVQAPLTHKKQYGLTLKATNHPLWPHGQAFIILQRFFVL